MSVAERQIRRDDAILRYNRIYDIGLTTYGCCLPGIVTLQIQRMSFAATKLYEKYCASANTWSAKRRIVSSSHRPVLRII